MADGSDITEEICKTKVEPAMKAAKKETERRLQEYVSNIRAGAIKGDPPKFEYWHTYWEHVNSNVSEIQYTRMAI